MKVAVIVPVYGVEAYLARCVESILAQTHGDFALVLVDDGSPDRCGEMCDAFAMRDDRVQVIHQANGGLSAARNAGLEWALANTGCEYVAFVDSDDWVEPNFLAELALAVARGAKIACCGFVRATQRQESGTLRVCEWREETSESYWARPDTVPCVACCKIFARELFDGIRFPVGRLHEDEFTTHRLLFQCERVMVTEASLYDYFVRSDSITGDEWTTERSLDHIAAVQDQIRFFAEKGLWRPLEQSRRLMCAYCRRAIEDLGRRDYRGLLREQLHELGYAMQLWNEELYRAAYPVRTRLAMPFLKLRDKIRRKTGR